MLRVSAWAVFVAGCFGTALSAALALTFADLSTAMAVVMWLFVAMFTALTFCGSYLIEMSR
jgi:hypothetical protein